MINSFQKLLIVFSSIPEGECPEPTFMEIAGYPHYENVVSNILAFFFDSEREHGLNDLLLKSLLQCLREEDSGELLAMPITVEREVSTDSGKRIDLVVDSPNLLIGIEHKMWAPLYNDLEDYTKHLEGEKVSLGRSVVKVVLSLKKQTSELKGGFVNITHDEFLDTIETNLGAYSSSANAKYLLQFLDFLKTIRNHNRMEEINTDMIDFMIEHEDKLYVLDEERKKVWNFLGRRASNVRSRIGEVPDFIHQWIWSKTVLVHDVTLKDENVVAIDCQYGLHGVRISVFIRRGPDANNSIAYLQGIPFFQSYKEDGKRKVIYDFTDLPLSSPDEEVYRALKNVLTEVRQMR